METLGQRIGRIRRDKGITVGKLAELAGLSRSFLSAVESGNSTLSVSNLGNIAHALGITPAYLLENTEEDSG